MLKRELGAVFDALEVVEATADDLWAGLAVVAGPTTEASDHPAGEGQRTFRVGVLLTVGGTLEAKREGLEERLVLRIESVSQQLLCRAIARLDNCMTVTDVMAAAMTSFIITCGSPMSASSILKLPVLSVRKYSSMVHRIR